MKLPNEMTALRLSRLKTIAADTPVTAYELRETARTFAVEPRAVAEIGVRREGDRFVPYIKTKALPWNERDLSHRMHCAGLSTLFFDLDGALAALRTAIVSKAAGAEEKGAGAGRGQ
jgi:hypothetical protein